MIDLHYWTTPNGHKITIFLEETQLQYRIVPVDIRTGNQFHPDTKPNIDDDSRKLLFGQTATSVKLR